MDSQFSHVTRRQSIQKMQEDVFDLVIIGGGINGAGVAREACLRGMKVALVEAQDFASGTSSRSSKLIHGGIRYLENLEFHLVFEALNERAKLFRMAPHLVHPLRFMIPLYRGGRVGMFKMGLGMWLYDALALFDVPEVHERLDAQQTVQRQGLLQSHDLLGSYIYSDAYMDDDRLVHETLRSAMETGRFECASYVLAAGFLKDEAGQIIGIKAEDQISKKKINLRARKIVSTVGPWTDELGPRLSEDWTKVLRPTKGVHLTFEKKRLPLNGAVVMGAEARIVFAIPRHEMVIVGTTDTDFSGDPASVSVTREDVAYLLGVVDQYFPQAKIVESDIVASYAGVRPLVKDQACSEGKTSREHQIWTNSLGISFVAGGKYTTYRRIAEQAVDHCLKSYAIEDRIRFSVGSSAEALNPRITSETWAQNPELVMRLVQETGLSQIEAEHLVDRHGAEAAEIIDRYGADQPYWHLEARHAIDHLMCFHLVDFFTRRVPLVLAQSDHGWPLADEIGLIFQQQLGWTDSQLQEEKLVFRQYLDREFSWKK